VRSHAARLARPLFSFSRPTLPRFPLSMRNALKCLPKKNRTVANWTLAEFLFELEHDATRKVLFVEGLRDLSFWRNLVPSTVRGDTVIYPISVIQFESAEGGERGRMFCIASAVLASKMSVRVLFFADADYDRIFAREPHTWVRGHGAYLAVRGRSKLLI
jgi:hypothetical protein